MLQDISKVLLERGLVDGLGALWPGGLGEDVGLDGVEGFCSRGTRRRGCDEHCLHESGHCEMGPLAEAIWMVGALRAFLVLAG